MTRTRYRDYEPDSGLYDAAWGAPVIDEPVDHPHFANLPNPSIMHHERVALGKGFGRVSSIADLSCGDGAIARELAAFSGIEPILGDMGRGHALQGSLQATLPQIGVVDLYVCSETIEHLDDPDSDLRLIRDHCRGLLLTTPVDEDQTSLIDGEVALAPGHLWAWAREDVEAMIRAADFEVSAFVLFDMTPYWYTWTKFGLWACR